MENNEAVDLNNNRISNWIDFETGVSDRANDGQSGVLEDSNILCKIFPPEIWTHIFDDFLSDSPEDLEKLSNASPYLRKLLQGKRVQFLSKNVFQTFYEWLSPKSSYADLRDVGKANQIDILKLRLVSPSWNLSLEGLIFEQRISWNSLRHPYVLGKQTQIYKFLRHFKDTHPPESSTRTPFVGRYLFVRADRGQREYWDHVLTLLEVYGHHIWHLVIASSRADDQINFTPHNFCLYLKEILLWTPNLKTLGMDCSPNLLINEGHLQMYPLRKLKHLQHFCVSAAPHAIFSKILGLNHHLPRLSVNFRQEQNLNFQMKSLTNVEISLLPGVDNKYYKFVSPIAGNWPLKTLKFMDNRRTRLPKWGELFDMLSATWGSTLNELQLQFARNMDLNGSNMALKDSLNRRLLLPNVKKLFLETEFRYTSIDFLLEMKCLEIVKIRPRVNPVRLMGYKPLMLEAKTKQIVQWVEFEERMYDSNMWTLFPALKTFKVMEYNSERGIEYRRAEWKRKCSKKLFDLTL